VKGSKANKFFAIASKKGMGEKGVVDGSEMAALHIELSDCRFESWPRYVYLRTSFYIVEESPIWDKRLCCTCREGMKKRPCRHSVMLMCELGLLKYPRNVIATPIEQKRKRGRPEISKPEYGKKSK
jgi:hypothetical protein